LKDSYDVVIGGSGIAGSTTSMILAKNGLDVVMIEAKSHPRFAVGEGLLPQSSMWMWIVGEYFDIPEIQHLSDTEQVIEHITNSCGIKHSIGFAYHDDDRLFNGDQCHQLIPPNLPLYSESHFVREHIDHYLVQSATEYGVDYVDTTPITDVEINEDVVTIYTDQAAVDGEFYIDATGNNSVLSKKMGYQDETPELETNSRAIFTHVEGLQPFDDLIDNHPQQSKRLHDGTLHHVFDGGWMWVIPFDNFERSGATKASIGLVLDRKKYPVDKSLEAEEEFYKIIVDFPDIECHLNPVEAVRPWIRTDRLQRTSSQSAGHRHYLTNHTYGFVDPLYSTGLVSTFESVFVSSNLLLEAFEENDFSAQQFEPLNDLHRRQVSDSDQVISNAYKAMGDFRVWSAWTQMWLAQILFHDSYIARHCFKYLESGDVSEFDRLLEESSPGSDAPFVEAKEEMYDVMTDTLDTYVNGERGADETADIILNEMERAEWLPKHIYDWGAEEARHIDFSDPESIGDFIEWGKTDAPDPLRKGVFDFELPEMSRQR